MFIDEYVEDFYEKLPIGNHNPANFCFGQIFYTHAYYPHEDIQLWRPTESDSDRTQTIATTFRIESAGQDAFRRSLPLQTPKLETNEEFLVLRAKRRPVVLIQTEKPLDGLANKGFKAKLNRRRVIVGQVFSLADPDTKYAKYDPAIIKRIRLMEFPQLMFLPERAGIFRVDSLLRLDEIQCVFASHLESKEFCLSDEVTNLLRSQLEFILTNSGPSDYTDLRDLLRNS